MTQEVFNKITNEKWLCKDINDTILIEGKPFIEVFRADRPTPVLMNKDSIYEVVTNDMKYGNNQIHG